MHGNDGSCTPCLAKRERKCHTLNTSEGGRDFFPRGAHRTCGQPSQICYRGCDRALCKGSFRNGPTRTCDRFDISSLAKFVLSLIFPDRYNFILSLASAIVRGQTFLVTVLSFSRSITE